MRERSSNLSRSAWPSWNKRRPRLLGSIPRQSGLSKAVRAAWTAASMSSFKPLATFAIGRFVAGSRTSTESPPTGSTHFPPMKRRCFGSSIEAPPHATPEKHINVRGMSPPPAQVVDGRGRAPFQEGARVRDHQAEGPPEPDVPGATPPGGLPPPDRDRHRDGDG